MMTVTMLWTLKTAQEWTLTVIYKKWALIQLDNLQNYKCAADHLTQNHPVNIVIFMS